MRAKTDKFKADLEEMRRRWALKRKPGPRPKPPSKLSLDLKKMAVGHSLWFEPYSPTVRSRLMKASYRAGVKITCHHRVKGGVDGLKVLRVA